MSDDLERVTRPTLYRINGQILIGPHPINGVRCVARTSAGKRCKNLTEYGQTAGWTTLESKRGQVTFYDIGRSDRWLSQRCTVHDTAGAVDFCAPDWEPFDPDRNPEHIHQPYVRELPDTWQF